MKKIFYIFSTISFLFVSCEDYIDVNKEQTNNASYNSLAPNQMLAGAINNYTSNQVGTLSTYGNRLTYVWGLNSGFTSTDPAYTHIYDSNSYVANFENTYLFADNFQDILDKKDQFPSYDHHFGIAKIFKVMSMDYITALYGDVPYSEAFKNNISSPKYDDDKQIIPKLFAELDEARVLLSKTGSSVKVLGKEDIVFKGNISNWMKFLNTVELRLLLRLSKTNDPALISLRTTRFAKLEGIKNFISQDVTVNPGYNSTTLAQRSPLYRFYGRNEAFNDWLSANRSNAAGDYIAKILNGTLASTNITADIVDPRRSRMFGLVGGVVVGNVQGIFPSTEISRFASFYTGRSGATAADADQNGCARDAFLMLAAESYFLQAEAIQRGYLTGDAKKAFQDGIVASFTFYSTPFGNLTASTLAPLNSTTYITTTDSKNGLGWTGSTDKINAIITQKYLALAQWQGIELYIDHLRTGFPVLPLPVGVNNTVRPNRLIYPTSEYSSNSANTIPVSNSELFTINSKTPYYLQ